MTSRCVIITPHSARPTYGVASHVVIWSVSIVSGVVLALLLLPDAHGGPGTHNDCIL